MNLTTEDRKELTGGCCGKQLAKSRGSFTCMRGSFEDELPACAECGLVLISGELANNRMADAGRIPED